MPRPPIPREIPGTGRWGATVPRAADESLFTAAWLVARISEKLEYDREVAGRSRRQLAAELGIDEGTLRALEDGRTWPTLWVFTKVAAEFEIEVPRSLRHVEVGAVRFPVRTSEWQVDLGVDERQQPVPVQEQLRFWREVETKVPEFVMPKWREDWPEPDQRRRRSGRWEPWVDRNGQRTADEAEALKVAMPVPVQAVRRAGIKTPG